MSSSPPPPHSTLRIGVVGCTHGELDLLYRRVHEANATAPDKRPIDLLICCGDFQAVRNEADLRTMACPDKYKSMQDFWRYYTGERTPPVPTLFIGGNHESAAHCGELPLGGWVAPGIYYLGTSGCVNFGGVRIAGVSGIFKSHDCWKGYFERPPYSPGDLKSINHQRAFDFWRCAHLCGGGGGGGGAGGGSGGGGSGGGAATAAAPVDIFLTHDWPQGIVEHGDKAALLRKKPFFREDVEKGELGSPPSMQLLHALQPRHWFSGHLHCRFAATVHHPTTPPTATHFLALDKPVQGRNYFEVMDIPVRSSPTLDGGFTHPIPKAFHYDPLWMAAVVATHGVTPLGSAPARRDSLPPPSPPSPALIQSVAVALATMSSAFAGEGGGGGGGSSAVDMVAAAKANPLHPIAIPLNFQPTAPGYKEEGRGRGSGSGSGSGNGSGGDSGGSSRRGNPQMDTLLWALGLPHITTFPCEEGGGGGVGRGVQDYLSQVSAVFAALPPDMAVGAAGAGSASAGGLMGGEGGAEVKDANALDID